jgi:hypothetical protein
VDKPFGRPDREALAPDLNILGTEHALVKILLLHGQAFTPDLNTLDTEHAPVEILQLYGDSLVQDLSILEIKYTHCGNIAIIWRDSCTGSQYSRH